MSGNENKGAKQPTAADCAAWVVEMGKDVNGRLYFSYNARLHEFYCLFCQDYFPGGLYCFTVHLLRFIYSTFVNVGLYRSSPNLYGFSV
jgi:hypothetical protein